MSDGNNNSSSGSPIAIANGMETSDISSSTAGSNLLSYPACGLFQLLANIGLGCSAQDVYL